MINYVNIHTHHPTGQHLEPQGVGTHPWDAEQTLDKEEVFDGAELIGEIGLDFAKDIDRATQEIVFRRQLAKAEEMNLPVVLHCVKAFEPMMKILAGYHPKAVIFHGFIGSEQQAERALNRGYYLSFGVKVSHSPKSIKALMTCPLEQLFIETDESDISIEEAYRLIAEIRGIDTKILAEKIRENYDRIFTK